MQNQSLEQQEQKRTKETAAQAMFGQAAAAYFGFLQGADAAWHAMEGIRTKYRLGEVPDPARKLFFGGIENYMKPFLQYCEKRKINLKGGDHEAK